MARPESLGQALDRQPRSRLATLPTALEPGPRLPGGAQLLVKRDDLTGLGLGGNKARKLEFLCGAAEKADADTLVTVGAAQSNHARMTAAAGAVLGMDVHLVLGGEPDPLPTGNQLLSSLFGARLHHQYTEDWAELGAALDGLADEVEAHGHRPYRLPMGGSTAVGALGFIAAWIELMDQCEAAGVRPTALVHASSTGGTHGGLLAGRAVWEAAGLPAPQVLAVSVAKDTGDLAGRAVQLARGALEMLGLGDVEVGEHLVELDEERLGERYAVPTEDGDRALSWAARHGAWVLDRTYTGKGFAGLLGAAESGRFGAGDTVVFWHTGGHPAVFTRDGSPPLECQIRTEEVA